jgi:hypothetical protein|eukprot:SAG25_NODE_341_length_9456_cov_13.967938_2_plen_130_part_00
MLPDPHARKRAPPVASTERGAALYLSRPAAWSPAFNIREREGTEQFTVGAATSSSGFIACEQHCRVASEWAGSELSALLPPQRQKTGADQLQRYGLRDLLQLLRVHTASAILYCGPVYVSLKSPCLRRI